MKLLTRLWRLLDRAQRRRIVLLQGLSLLMALCSLIGIAAILPFFTLLTQPNGAPGGRLVSMLAAHLHFASLEATQIAVGIGFVAVVLLANGVNLLGALAINRFSAQVGEQLNIRLFSAYLRRDYAFFAGTNSAVLERNVIHEIARITNGILPHALTLVTNAITAIAIVVSVLFVNSVAGAAAIVGFGTSYAIIYTSTRRRLRRNGSRESTLATQRSQIVNESFAAIKELFIYGRQSYFIEKFSQVCRGISATTASTTAISQAPKYLLEVLTVSGLVGVALTLNHASGESKPWLAQLTFMAFAAYRLLPALQQIFFAVVKIRANTPAFDNIFEAFTEAPESVSGTGTPSAASFASRRAISKLTFENVSFRYRPAGDLALEGVSFEIRAGSLIGLTGANGSGKTTLANLMMGLLTPTSGRLLIDGVALDASAHEAWRASVAYVPQHICLVDATVAENVAFAEEPAHIDAARLREAAQLARADEFIERLPGRYQELLGEQGARISGGQRQRIGIARALYRDASFIVFDEATNALDMQSEAEIMRELKRLARERVIVVISHRPTLLAQCDRVLTLQHGRLSRAIGVAAL